MFIDLLVVVDETVPGLHGLEMAHPNCTGRRCDNSRSSPGFLRRSSRLASESTALRVAFNRTLPRRRHSGTTRC